MRDAWRELLFANETDTSEVPDPVAPAPVPESTQRKKARKKTDDGLRVHNFKGLLRQLSTLTKNICRTPTGESFETTVSPTALQRRAFERLKAL